MNHETNPILEKPGTASQMETGICDAANLAGGVAMLKGDVLNLPPGKYSMIVDEDGTVSCTLEREASEAEKWGLGWFRKQWTDGELEALNLRHG